MSQFRSATDGATSVLPAVVRSAFGLDRHHPDPDHGRVEQTRLHRQTSAGDADMRKRRYRPRRADHHAPPRDRRSRHRYRCRPPDNFLPLAARAPSPAQSTISAPARPVSMTAGARQTGLPLLSGRSDIADDYRQADSRPAHWRSTQLNTPKPQAASQPSKTSQRHRRSYAGRNARTCVVGVIARLTLTRPDPKLRASKL